MISLRKIVREIGKRWMLISFAGCILVCTSCRQMYIPPTANIPLFTSPDEFQPAISVGSSGYNLQLAYSPAYQIGLIGSASLNKIRNDSTLKVNYSHSAADIGMGYYMPLGEVLRLEFFAGYGFENTWDTDTSDKCRRLFLQPNFGVSSRFVDAGVAARFSMINHYKTGNVDALYSINDKAFMLEPSIVLRAGYEQLKFFAQAGFGIPVGSSDLGGRYKSTTLAFGFHLTFGKDYEMYID